MPSLKVTGLLVAFVCFHFSRSNPLGNGRQKRTILSPGVQFVRIEKADEAVKDGIPGAIGGLDPIRMAALLEEDKMPDPIQQPAETSLLALPRANKLPSVDEYVPEIDDTADIVKEISPAETTEPAVSEEMPGHAMMKIMQTFNEQYAKDENKEDDDEDLPSTTTTRHPLCPRRKTTKAIKNKGSAEEIGDFEDF